MSTNPASDALRADHRKIENHLDTLLFALKHLNEGRVAGIHHDFLAIQRLSEVHFEQEERIFYPEIRPKAPELLARMDQEHETVRETERCLAELLGSIPASPDQREMDELHRIGIEFHDAIQVHIVDEEDQVLKLADSLLSAADQQRIAESMRQLADSASARPQP